MAALLVRLRIHAYLRHFDAAARGHVKGLILRRLASDTFRPCRLALCALAASVAKTELPSWPEVLPFIGQAAASGSADMREMAIMLLSAVLDAASGGMLKYLSASVPLIGRALSDSDSRVQIQALRACTQALTLLPFDADTAPFQPLVGPLMGVIRGCLSSGEDELVGDAFDTLHDILVVHFSLLEGSFDALLKMLMTVITSEHFEVSTRDKASVVLMDMIGAQPTAVVRSGTIPHMLASILHMTSKLETDPIETLRDMLMGKDTDETGATAAPASTWGSAAAASMPPGTELPMRGAGQDMGDETDGVEIGARIFNCMALHLPARHYYRPVVEATSTCLRNADWKIRFAGLMLFAMSVEGMRNPIRDDLAGCVALLTGPISPSSPDPSAAVRDAACFAIGAVAEYLSNFALLHNAVLMPALIGRLSDPEMVVQDKAAYAIEMLVDTDGTHLLSGYRDVLVRSVGTLLHSPHMALRLRGLNLLGSVAIGIGKDFAPMVPFAVSEVWPFLSATAPALLESRACATDALGYIAKAVGKDAFSSVLSSTDLMARLGENLEIATAILGDEVDGAVVNPTLAPLAAVADKALADKLRDYTFTFFSNLVIVLGDESAPMIAPLFPLLKQTLGVARVRVNGVDDQVGMGSEAMIAARNVPESFYKPFAEATDEFPGDDDDDDDDGVDDDDDDSDGGGHGDGPVAAHLSLEDTGSRAAAMHLLGTIVANVGAPMEALLADAIRMTGDNVLFYEEEVRENAVLAMGYLPRCVIKCDMASGKPLVPPPGHPEGSTVNVPPPKFPTSKRVQDLIDTSVVALLTNIAHERQPSVVAASLHSIIVWVKDFGAVCVGKHLNGIFAVIVSGLREQLKCQYPEDDDDEEEAEEEAEDSNTAFLLMDELYDLLSWLGRRGGPPLWEAGLSKLFPVLMEFARKPRPPIDQSGVVGALAEMAEGLGATPGWAEAAVSQAGPLVLAALRSPAPELLRNGLVAAGTLFHGVGPLARPVLPELVPLLLSHCKRTPDSQGVLADNAAAALCRLLSVHASAMDIPTCVKAVVAMLPLVDDRDEDHRVWGTMVDLIKAREPTVMSLMHPLVGAAAAALGPASPVRPASRGVVLRMLVEFAQANPGATKAAMDALPGGQGAELAARVAAVAGGADIVSAARVAPS
jgi:importin-4